MSSSSSSWAPLKASFLIHPLENSEESVRELFLQGKPRLARILGVQWYTPGMIRWLRHFISRYPAICFWGSVDNIQGLHNGSPFSARLLVQGISFTPNELADPALRPVIDRAILRAGHWAAQQGATHLGLGAHLSIYVSRNRALQEKLKAMGLTLIDGNSLTAYAVFTAILKAVVMLTLPPGYCLGIVGATGSVGEKLAFLAADLGIPLLLHGRNEKKLMRLAAGLNKQMEERGYVARAEAVLDDKERIYLESDIVVTATGEPTPWYIPARLLKNRGSHPLVIFDMGRPSNVDPRSVEQFANVLYAEGVNMTVPGDAMHNVVLQLGGDWLYPCACQTLAMRIAERHEHQLGRLSLEEVQAIGQLAEEMGMAVAPLTGANAILLTELDYARVRRTLRSRTPA